MFYAKSDLISYLLNIYKVKYAPIVIYVLSIYADIHMHIMRRVLQATIVYLALGLYTAIRLDAIGKQVFPSFICLVT